MPIPRPILYAALLLLISPLLAQDFGTTPRSTLNPQIARANAALEARDYPAALKLLLPLAAANPQDPHILYDLASTQDALDQPTPAEQSYRAAIAADPTFLDPHVALGLLLARAARLPEARTELLAATALPTAAISDQDSALKARAYRALARIDQKPRPSDARDELLAALKLSPETPEDTLLAAELAAAAGNGAPAAEAAYRRLLAANPNDPAATAALARLLIQQTRAADAEALLTPALAAHPHDPALVAQLVSADCAEGKPAAALPEVEALHAATPNEPAVTRLLANLYLQSSDDARAEPLLAALSAKSPNDPTLADDRARTLIHLHRFAEAEAALTRALADPSRFPTPADLGNAAGDLAFAASANNNPELTLQALQLRATVLPTSAPVMFLTAISQDKLHHVKLAQQAYQQFLAASNGSNPDQEFEARHRLVALQHMK